MEYKTVAEAKDLPGLRLVFTIGGPASWSQLAKGIFYVKHIRTFQLPSTLATDPILIEHRDFIFAQHLTLHS